MGLIAEVLAFTRRNSGGVRTSDVKVDPGGGANLLAEHFADAGDDSQPLPGDSSALSESPGAGRMQVTGYADTRSTPKAGPGEKRTYARAQDGTVVGEIWLKADGTISIEVLKSGGATIKIKSDGPIIVEGPDVRVGSGASQGIARVGDLALGSIRAKAGGVPLVPDPTAPPVPVVVQLVSGSGSAKA